MNMWTFFLVVGFVTIPKTTAKNYSNYYLIETEPLDIEKVETLAEIANEMEVSIMNEASLEAANLLTFPGSSASYLFDKLSDADISFRVKSTNLQQLIDDQMRDIERLKPGRSATEFDMNNYHTYEEIVTFMKTMANRYAKRAEIKSIGRSIENRDIWVLILNSGEPSTRKLPVVIYECGVHAREWISPATCLYIIQQILRSDDSVLRSYEFHILPLINPDGYHTTWTTDRLHRKNKRKVQTCIGVDLNRNFDINWKLDSSTCHEEYTGSRPFSEPETVAVKEHVEGLIGRIMIYYSLHSYGQKWMHPFGYKQEETLGAYNMANLGKIAAQKIKAFSGTEYRTGPIYRIVYQVSGSSVDWVLVKAKAQIAFAIELPDINKYGFLLPPRLILPSVQEVWQGMMAIFHELPNRHS